MFETYLGQETGQIRPRSKFGLMSGTGCLQSRVLPLLPAELEGSLATGALLDAGGDAPQNIRVGALPGGSPRSAAPCAPLRASPPDVAAAEGLGIPRFPSLAFLPRSRSVPHVPSVTAAVQGFGVFPQHLLPR